MKAQSAKGELAPDLLRSLTRGMLIPPVAGFNISKRDDSYSISQTAVI